MLKETISSLVTVLARQSDFEILIIDNNSTDNTSQIIQTFQSLTFLKYFKEEKQGLSHARNRGILEANYEILVFLDDDIELDSMYFKVLDKIYEDSNVDIVGGKVLPFDSNIPQWLPKKYYYLVSIFDQGNITKNVANIMGANFSMRKRVAKSVGFYNVELGRKGNNLMGGEENDYVSRARNLGYKILYCSILVVQHKIKNKLNKKYILEYAYLNGKSEQITDSRVSKVWYLMKSCKCTFMVIVYYCFKFLTLTPKNYMFLSIEYHYSLGYLKLDRHIKIREL
jgi:glycosyltransferase involved in cell wall biosynthesis